MTFDEFVAQRSGGLLRFAMVVTCDGRFAEDVVQNALVRASGTWHRIAAMERPESYLRAMVVTEYLSWRRRAHRLQPVSGPAIDHGGEAELIRRVVELPPRERTVIALRFFDGRGGAETADVALPRALEQIAAQAPDPSALQARLADRIRAHRQRRAVLATAGLLTGGAVIGIPTASALRVPAPPESTATTAPLGLRPTWVPDGLVAYSRSASVDDLYSEQRWTAPQDDAALLGGTSPPTRLSLWVGRISTVPDRPLTAPLFDTPNTTVGGRPARSGPPHLLKWLITDDILAGVAATRRDDLDLHRLAESMVDDDRAVCEVAMHAGWLPTVVARGQSLPLTRKVHVWGTSRHWVQELTFADRLITIRLASTPGALDESGLRQPFEPTMLRGRPGRIRHVPGGSGVEKHVEIRFDLPDDRYAQVTCHIPVDDPVALRSTAIRIAEELSIGPNPDLRWLGRPLP
ncbi:hypothetical protein F4553_001254 [Allocatelliglobosispora scoriae]|uniref:RNA polymerase sigma-70 region 2 domain-containing protein n=1 Tax=Allocatelliglobosispora scoriae TaxID=643052 RepID=A0A841BJR1_9ACTN|nr:hypothetical protein [Allocatelliglobosispora scoriae]MBB5867875.1 hypothetical protein [Allocatelliglobosispora scoriae]